MEIVVDPAEQAGMLGQEEQAQQNCGNGKAAACGASWPKVYFSERSLPGMSR